MSNARASISTARPPSGAATWWREAAAGLFRAASRLLGVHYRQLVGHVRPMAGLDFAKKHAPCAPAGLFETGYFEEALGVGKASLRPLLVYFHAPHHPDAAAYLAEAVASAEMKQWLDAHEAMLWACSIEDARTYELSGQMQVRVFPCIALLAPLAVGRLRLAGRIEGNPERTRLLGGLAAIWQEVEDSVREVVGGQEQAQSARRMREEQDAAYQRSLAIDEQRARHRKSATEPFSVPEEPQDGDVFLLALHFPSGERRVRRFRPTDRLEDVYEYCASVAGTRNLRLRTGHPSCEHARSSVVLAASGLARQCRLFVERAD